MSVASRSAVSTALGFCLAASGAVAHHTDGEFSYISQLTQWGIQGNSVGFSLSAKVANVGTDPIPWGFPVLETAANPWIQQNGFQGQEGTHNHEHADDGTMAGEVGPHPHLRFYLYYQPGTGQNSYRIGSSDIKHAYRTADGNHHELAPGSIDTYSLLHNQDQSFYGPVNELDPDTLAVAQHDHFASIYTINGVTGWHRDHGEGAFSGGVDDNGKIIPADPGHTQQNDCFPITCNIDHMLQAPLSLMKPVDVDGDGIDDRGARWWMAGDFYVFNDQDRTNNQAVVEIFPTWNESNQQLSFTQDASSFSHDTSGIPNLVPLPAAIWAFLSGLAGLFGLVNIRRQRAAG